MNTLGKQTQQIEGEPPEETIQRFEAFRKAEGKAEGTIKAYRRILQDLADFFDKPFIEITRNDLETYLADWVERESTKIKGKSYKEIGDGQKQKTSESYMNFIRSVLKYFFKWLYGTEDFPDCVKWIKPKRIQREIDPRDLLTDEEVFRLIRAADNPRDKALIHVLYESGARISEIRTLKVRDVSFETIPTEKQGPILKANLVIPSRKTKGNQRGKYLGLYDSAQALQAWLEEHPNPKPDQPLWVSLYSNFGEMVSLTSIRRMLKRLARKCEITKPVHPHALRHAQVTASAKYMADQELKQKFGWTAGSRMLQTYSHITDQAVDEKEQQMRGITRIQDKRKRYLDQVKCERCGNIYSAGEKRICECGRPLDPDLAKLWDQEKQVKEELLADFIAEIRKTDAETLKQAILLLKYSKRS